MDCSTSDAIKSFKQINKGANPLKCDLSEKGFTRSGQLSIYKLIHSGVKPFICDL